MSIQHNLIQIITPNTNINSSPGTIFILHGLNELWQKKLKQKWQPEKTSTILLILQKEHSSRRLKRSYFEGFECCYR